MKKTILKNSLNKEIEKNLQSVTLKPQESRPIDCNDRILAYLIVYSGSATILDADGREHTVKNRMIPIQKNFTHLLNNSPDQILSYAICDEKNIENNHLVERLNLNQDQTLLNYKASSSSFMLAVLNGQIWIEEMLAKSSEVLFFKNTEQFSLRVLSDRAQLMLENLS
jgi:hypothetical protein